MWCVDPQDAQMQLALRVTSGHFEARHVDVELTTRQRLEWAREVIQIEPWHTCQLEIKQSFIG